MKILETKERESLALALWKPIWDPRLYDGGVMRITTTQRLRADGAGAASSADASGRGEDHTAIAS